MGSRVSRREFVVGGAIAAVAMARPRAQAGPLTAQQTVDRIRASAGVEWRTQTVDGFKAGDPATPVTGIATTAMASVDVLRQAIAARQNLIITQEPTFYTADDNPVSRGDDPVHAAKKALIDSQRLVIWRFSDHWNLREPNENARALATALGWTAALPDAAQIYRIPETTLAGLVKQVRTRLGTRGGLRVVGQGTMRVRTVFISPGTTDMRAATANLPRADVILSGEPREWEAVPYTLDTWSAGEGQARGMIAIGRVVSEGPGMQACATWIKSLFPDLPVAAVTTADPYWNPAS